MTEIRIGRLNANDDAYLLTEWTVADGQQVRAGEVLAVVETSKAAQDLVSDHDGVLLQLVPAGAECAPDAVIGRLFATAEERRRFVEHSVAAPPAAASGPAVTAPARALLDELGIAPERLGELLPELRDAKVVRRADVEWLAAEPRVTPPPVGPATPGGHPDGQEPATVGDDRPGAGRVQRLPRVQQAVAATVEESHRTIPAAYVAVRVDAGAALALARRLTKQLRALVGLPELVVAAVARLHARFPLCFATPLDARTVRLADAPHVGVTIDMGKGLFVPVVRDAARSPLGEIAQDLMRFRLTALRGRFRPEELTGANILVALNNEGGVVTAVPVVFPGHACAVSLAAAHDEPAVDASGQLTVRPVANVGLAYDHRVLNGRDAVLFLEALRAALESPEQLADAPPPS